MATTFKNSSRSVTNMSSFVSKQAIDHVRRYRRKKGQRGMRLVFESGKLVAFSFVYDLPTIEWRRREEKTSTN
jgi:hypothetical protein